MNHAISFLAAGVKFRKEYAANMDRICSGDKAILIKEPDNKYDPMAIKVMWVDPETKEQYHVGYVPRDKPAITMQTTIWSAMDNPKEKVLATVFNHFPSNKTWQALEIAVTITDVCDSNDAYDPNNMFDQMQEERMWPTIEDEQG